MITIKNTQKKVPFCTTQYFKKAQAILRHLHYADFDLGIWLTTDKTMQKYNKQFRNKDSSTDVLSFPYHDNIQAGQRIIATNQDDKNLGDIIISPSYILENKKKITKTFMEQMDTVLVHGICHLLGYDHITDEDFSKMAKLEDELLQIIQHIVTCN